VMVAAKARERKDSGMSEGVVPASKRDQRGQGGIGPAEREDEREGRTRRGGDWEMGLEATVALGSVHVGE